MSCGTGQCGPSRGGSGSGCVRDTLRKIIEAQNKIVSPAAVNCHTSCENAIDELLSPSSRNNRPRYTTIPVTLINGCGKPFIGSGIVNRAPNGERRDYFDCVESPVFKVRGFTNRAETCVSLELLIPVHHHRDGDQQEHQVTDCGTTTCDFFKHPIHNFKSTGICINVDVNCFCGITCLDPITPIPL